MNGGFPARGKAARLLYPREIKGRNVLRPCGLRPLGEALQPQGVHIVLGRADLRGRSRRFSAGNSAARPQGRYWLMREKATAPGAKCSATQSITRLGLGQFPGKEQVPDDKHPV